MRFTKLVVESFQAIQKAEVEFGPGLNILYGPNDLGKSTLASAIRAALLCAPGSSEGLSFATWYADETPRVALGFGDGTGHHWRVRKAFGHSGMTTATELHHSKDGTSFSLDCKGREVEEKLRGLLAWGIPAPGGKGGPRGMPTSFLANVLLAAQTDVDSILGESLKADLDDKGKLRLSKALATLAQDPLFKTVFVAAQREFDRCFTETGKRKRGRTSKFTEATDHVKELETELAEIRRQQAESAVIQQSVNTLRERCAAAELALADAAGDVAAVNARLAQTKARSAGRERLAAASTALAAIDAHAKNVAEIDLEIGKLEAVARACDEKVARATSEISEAEAALKAAEEAHRLATSDDAQKDRELRHAQLAAQSAETASKKQLAQARKTELARVLTARAEARAARAEAKASVAALAKLRTEIIDARDRAAAADIDVETARALLAFGRWRAAVADADAHKKAAEAAAADRAVGQEKDAAATRLDGEAAVIADAVERRRAILPTPEGAKLLERLQHDLEIAEAALGGGLSVTVKPRKSLSLRATVDQEPATEAPDLAVERVFEAARSLVLSIGDLVDIEVTAGAADKRRTVEGLRSRWKGEALPVLARAEVASLDAVHAKLADTASESTRAATLQGQAAQLRKDAAGARERAVVHETQAHKPTPTDADLEARKKAIGDVAHARLAEQLQKLGTAWEQRAETLHRQKEEAAKTTRAQLGTLEQSAQVAQYKVTATAETADKLEAASEAAHVAVGKEEPEALLRATEEALTALSDVERKLSADLAQLATEATGKVAAAKQAVDKAQLALEARKKNHGAMRAESDAAKARLNGRIGQAGAHRAQLETMDRPAAVALCELGEKELAAIPSGPAITEADVAAAEKSEAIAKQALDIAREELHKSEGALTKVGGATVGEEVARLEEAVAIAASREKDLELDADAWKLLRDTLRDVENEEGAHLGRALAGPVATRFGELTAGRYKNLRLDALLKTESLDIATGKADGPDVLEALSTGTRDQLATLIRLTIADQLKTAIILDDHLVHTDPKRLAWFREVLTKTALNAQVIVLTCRPEDYVSKNELPDAAATRDLAGGAVRVIDMFRVVKRWEGVPSVRPAAGAGSGADQMGAEVHNR